MKILQIIAGVLLVVCVSGCKLGGGGGGGSASSGIAMVSSGSSQSSDEDGNNVAYIAELAGNNTTDDQGSDRQAPAAIPEPATMITLGLGAAALFVVRNKKRGSVR